MSDLQGQSKLGSLEFVKHIKEQHAIWAETSCVDKTQKWLAESLLEACEYLKSHVEQLMKYKTNFDNLVQINNENIDRIKKSRDQLAIANKEIGRLKKQVGNLRAAGVRKGLW